MNEIKYRKGDIVKEVDSYTDQYYLFKILKDISLELWNNPSIELIPLDYTECLYAYPGITRTSSFTTQMFTGIQCVFLNAKQYKVNHMNTALYKILHKGEINEDIDNIFIDD